MDKRATDTRRDPISLGARCNECPDDTSWAEALPTTNLTQMRSRCRASLALSFAACFRRPSGSVRLILILILTPPFPVGALAVLGVLVAACVLVRVRPRVGN